MNAETAITNLLYRYAELMDAGNLAGTAALFDHARIILAQGYETDSAGLLEVWKERVMIHPCGTPRTRHVVTNPIIEIDEAAGAASCRSYYTVLQQTETLPLQIIAAGRYHDTFARVDGVWRFASRDYSLFDMQGDLSQHLRG
ncbi:nuclear transport factor 2 family protein [Novosphingobium sp. B 225]|uniref:nuclear transport factor 2 family protein n=1 Tax=Novosphingobium sp. B 225 TaxID=1961849 RepID=UPI000B4BBB34|nr:nuclear transport factor 2 family protein [Novosphingobium sp. B 225]